MLAEQKQQPSVAGLWRVEFVTPLGQVGVNMTINQSGTKLSGQVTDEYGEWATALADVPTKVLIFRFCLSALKNSSICQRSL